MSWNEDIKKELGSCGENVFIGENVYFANPNLIHLGDRVRIDPFVLITTGLKTGSNIQIMSHAVLSGGSRHTITLKNWNFIGYGSKLFCASEDYSGKFGPVNEFWGSNKVHHGDIEFENYCGIASNVVLMPGIVLPEGCCIGLNSVVRRNEWDSFNLPEKKVGMAYDMHMTHEIHPLEPWSVYVGDPLYFHSARDEESVRSLSLSPDFLRGHV